MYCPKCGNAIQQSDANFCIKCGAPLPTDKTVAPQSITTPAIVEPAAPDSRPRNGVVQHPKPHKWVYRLCSLALFSAGVAALAYAFSSSKSADPAGKIGFIVGYYFWVPFVVFWIWKSAFKKRKGMGILLASLAFALIASYQSVKIVGEAKENQRILAAAQKIIPELLRGDPVSDADLSSAGSFKPALESLRDLFSSIKADSGALINKQNSPDLQGILLPDRLTNMPSVDRTLAALKDYGQTLALTRGKIDADIDAYSRKIDTLDLPEDEMASFKSGAIPGLQKARTAITEFVGIETNFCSDATAMMNFIKQNQGRFVVRNDQILFARNADAQVYNSDLASLRHDSQEEAGWRQRQTAINNKNLDDLKHLSE